MQPLFGALECLRSEALRMRGQGGADANGLTRLPGSATDWTWWLIDFVA